MPPLQPPRQTVGEPREDGARDVALVAVARQSAEQPARAVACHMDFSPRNWVYDAQASPPRLTVIDWERARADHWVQIFQRLTEREWRDAPQLRKYEALLPRRITGVPRPAGRKIEGRAAGNADRRQPQRLLRR